MKKCFSWKWLISWIIFQLLQYSHTVPSMNYSLYTYCYSFHSKYKLFILYIKQFCGLNEVFSKFGGIWIFGLILVETLGLVLETFSWWSKFITLVGLLTFQNHMLFLVYFLSASSLWFGDASYKLITPSSTPPIGPISHSDGTALFIFNRNIKSKYTFQSWNCIVHALLSKQWKSNGH